MERRHPEESDSLSSIARPTHPRAYPAWTFPARVTRSSAIWRVSADFLAPAGLIRESSGRAR